jgi:hypothetical protein
VYDKEFETVLSYTEKITMLELKMWKNLQKVLMNQIMDILEQWKRNDQRENYNVESLKIV